MPALLDLQKAFGASILFGDDALIAPHIVEEGFSASERLRIYRNSCRSVLTAALRLAYPAVERLVGRDFFEMTAARFIEENPPRSAYLNEYGGAFADFLGKLPSAAALPYLPDVARFEWALNIAANAPDMPAPDLGELAGIDTARHAELRFLAHPSVRLLDLSYPADRIADAVLGGDDEAMATVDLSTGPVRLIVWRGPEGVAAERLDLVASRFLRQLYAGEALGTLLDPAAPEQAVLLAEQFAKGRVSGFRLGDADPERDMA